MSLRDRVFMSAVRRIPRQHLTALAGKIAAYKVPTPLRQPVYRAFSLAVGADLSESAHPLASFERFNEFFTRELKPGVRTWTGEQHDWAMPADGTISVTGRVQQGQMLQVKGIDYDVGDLLGEDPAPWEGARYATIYLSPADYHRVHWPVSGSVHTVRSMGGELWPVNRASVQYVPQLFVENERTVSRVVDVEGRAGAVIMVGATIVGGIDLQIPTPSDADPAAFAAGEEHGKFYLGSTVVLLVQDKDKPLNEQPMQPGQKVQLGAPLWTHQHA